MCRRLRMHPAQAPCKSTAARLEKSCHDEPVGLIVNKASSTNPLALRQEQHSKVHGTKEIISLVSTLGYESWPSRHGEIAVYHQRGLRYEM